MPCYDGAGHALGMKLVVVQDNPQRPEDRIQATYMLLDPRTARPLLVVPANYLTDLRTAATSAVATKFLAREDVKVLGVFGTGRQARAHIKVMPLVRRFERVLVCGRNADASREFAQRNVRGDQACRSKLPTREPALLNPMCSAPALFADAAVRRQPAACRRPFESGGRISTPRARSGLRHCAARPRFRGDLRRCSRRGRRPAHSDPGRRIGRAHIAGDLHELVSGKKREGRTRRTSPVQECRLRPGRPRDSGTAS